jgi:hypothetical protein
MDRRQLAMLLMFFSLVASATAFMLQNEGFVNWLMGKVPNIQIE